MYIVQHPTMQDGFSALMWAALWGHSAVVKELLQRGADLTAQNGVGPSHEIYHFGRVYTFQKAVLCFWVLAGRLDCTDDCCA